MRHLLTITVALFLTHQAAYAADISVIAEATADHPALILIKGRFEKGEHERDIATFTAIASAQLHGAAVFLEGPGGSTLAGIRIGQTISKREFSTVVASDTTCASSCALAWLGGKQRFMGSSAKIGFHAARSGENLADISSAGNAMIGAYLYEIGITDLKAITYLTMNTQSTTWLTMSEATRWKIDMKSFAFTQDQWVWAGEAMDLRNRQPSQVLGKRIDTPGHFPAIGG